MERKEEWAEESVDTVSQIEVGSKGGGGEVQYTEERREQG